MKSLEYIVKNVLYETGESTTTNFHKFMQFGYRGFRELNLGMLANTSVATLTVADNLTAPLPADYISYTAIYVCIANRMYTLTLNDNLCLDRELDDCCEPVAEEEPRNCEGTAYWGFDSWRNGKYVGENYGLKGGFNIAGYYRIDHEKNRIQFSNLNSGMTIAMEYKSNGIDCEGNVLIPEECVECLIAFIMWKRIANNRNYSLGEKNEAKQNYFMYYEKAKFFLNSFTADEFLDQLYSSLTSAPKR